MDEGLRQSDGYLCLRFGRERCIGELLLVVQLGHFPQPISKSGIAKWRDKIHRKSGHDGRQGLRDEEENRPQLHRMHESKRRNLLLPAWIA